MRFLLLLLLVGRLGGDPVCAIIQCLRDKLIQGIPGVHASGAALFVAVWIHHFAHHLNLRMNRIRIDCSSLPRDILSALS